MDKRLEHIVIKYLNEFYGDLVEYKPPDEISYSTYYIRNKNVYMEKRLGEDLLINKFFIWEDLSNIFSLNTESIRYVITKWVLLTYNINNVYPLRIYSSYTGLLL